MKPSYFVVVGVIAAAALVSMARTESKPPSSGMCPKPMGVGLCVEECSTHDDCQAQGKLCCSNGCGHTCMEPEVPGSAAPDQKCTLMVTLASPNAPKSVADAVLQGVPKPSSHSHLSSVGIVILEYAVQLGSSDCCAAEKSLAAMSDIVKFVEYDGFRPACASPRQGFVSSDPPAMDDVMAGGSVIEPNQEEEPMMGAYGGSDAVDEESKAVWEQVLKQSPVHKDHDLKALGKPVSVRTQVVAGTNYYFAFAGGEAVEVFQDFDNTVEVQSVERR